MPIYTNPNPIAHRPPQHTSNKNKRLVNRHREEMRTEAVVQVPLLKKGVLPRSSSDLQWLACHRGGVHTGTGAAQKETGRDTYTSTAPRSRKKNLQAIETSRSGPTARC